MYLTDFHTHSDCSPDGSVPMLCMAQSAEKAGIRALCLTDHCDMLDGGGKLTPLFDWSPLRRQFAEARVAMGKTMQLSFGLELGEAQADPDAAHAILNQAPELDFVLGSVHNMSPKNGGADFYYLDYRKPEACYRALDDYFDSLAALAPMDCYDGMAHIIYPLRYMRDRDGQAVGLDDYWDRIRDILKTVVQTGRGIEVNTCRGRTVAEWEPVLRLFKQVGGELVTVGSDAHVPRDVGKGIADAYELMKATGFDRVAVYEQRKPRLIAI